MQFLKKSRGYIVQYDRKETVKELENDKRVESVEVTPQTMIIRTNPIKPAVVASYCKSILLKPVGRYVITLKALKTKISIDIKRVEGAIMDEWHHPHINLKWSTICWGSAEDDMYYIQANKDWYWAARKCLELLDDFDDVGLDVELVELLGLAQLQYGKGKKFKEKLRKKANSLLNRKHWDSDVFDDDYEEEEEEPSNDYYNTTATSWGCR